MFSEAYNNFFFQDRAFLIIDELLTFYSDQILYLIIELIYFSTIYYSEFGCCFSRKLQPKYYPFYINCLEIFSAFLLSE